MDRRGGLDLNLDEHRHCEVYMAGKSCHILRPVPIEHEYDPVIYKDAHYVTRYDEFAAAMAEPEPPFPIARTSSRLF